jgi:hypothetical protein
MAFGEIIYDTRKHRFFWSKWVDLNNCGSKNEKHPFEYLAMREEQTLIMSLVYVSLPEQDMVNRARMSTNLNMFSLCVFSLSFQQK